MPRSQVTQGQVAGTWGAATAHEAEAVVRAADLKERALPFRPRLSSGPSTPSASILPASMSRLLPGPLYRGGAFIELGFVTF